MLDGQAAALALNIIQSKATSLETSRAFDLNPSEVEQWVDEGKRGMENALRTKPLEVKEQYEKQLRELQETYMAKPCWSCVHKKSWPPVRRRGRKMILSLQQGLTADGFKVSLVKLCQRLEIPLRTVYYRSTKVEPKVQDHFVKPVKAMIEENRTFGYRTVAHLLGFNKNTVRRIFQLKGWQVRKRLVGCRSLVQALPSVAKAPGVGPLTCATCGRSEMAVGLSPASVIDCYSRELLDWHRSGRYGYLATVRHQC